MNKHLVIYTLINSFLLVGCGTTQHFVPPTPLPKGQFEGRICIGYTTSAFGQFSAYMTGYVGVEKNNTVGFTLSGFIFPSSVSFVRYWNTVSGSSSLQFHYNDLLGATFNPTFELDYAMSRRFSENYHSGKIGIGLYTTPFLRYLLGQKVQDFSVVPIVGYQFQRKALALEADMIYGQSKYFVSYYKKLSLHYLQDTNAVQGDRFRPMTIPHSSVSKIVKFSDDEPLEELRHASGWIIEIDSTKSIVISTREPYADCIVCGIESRRRSSYTTSDDHKVFWIWESFRGQEVQPTLLVPRIIELNMTLILKTYETGGDIILEEDTDIVERSINNVKSGVDDISFSTSWKAKNK
jgi:hypothetical protein